MGCSYTIAQISLLSLIHHVDSQLEWYVVHDIRHSEIKESELKTYSSQLICARVSHEGAFPTCIVLFDHLFTEIKLSQSGRIHTGRVATHMPNQYRVCIIDEIEHMFVWVLLFLES